jgi:hypothetical protein
MTTMTHLPDLPYALAYRHIDDLRAAADHRRHLPPRRPTRRVRRAVRSFVRWLWEGQLALVPPVVDPVGPRSS